MKKQGTFILLTVIGLLLAIAILITVATAMQSDPVMLKCPEEAQACVEQLMAAVSAGDYPTVSRLLYGNPDFTIPSDLQNPAADLMWDAYRKSFTCKFLTNIYTDETGLAADVALTCLDLSAVLESTHSHAKTLLKRRVDRAKSTSEIYDDDQNYREDVIAEVMRSAAAEALQECADIKKVSALTLHMVCEQGQWWVIPDAELLQVLSGDIVLLSKE